ncbi:MAG: PTS system, mannose/fructose/sorbose family, IIA component [Rhodanobacteraceae bacterium]|jgi:PTS system ascorbate-specific IIA component|nr:MAG: PTS system, mannose/fructose/sorbose family, IIA component [Rhodanobacteraceae bacterium]
MTTASALPNAEPSPAAGILLLTHEEIGHALISAAKHVLPRLPCQLDTLEVGSNDDPNAMLSAAARAARALDHGGGVLVLSDLYGSTPCNIANKLAGLGVHARCVSGLNLPMLLRVLNYPDKPLDELAEVAASGGRGGICIDKV